MSLRHAATLALVGWYLLMPPPERIATAYYTPLSEWKAVRTFDSRAACEKSRNALSVLDEKDYRSMTDKQKLMNLSLCIARDDPRLVGN